MERNTQISSVAEWLATFDGYSMDNQNDRICLAVEIVRDLIPKLNHMEVVGEKSIPKIIHNS